MSTGLSFAQALERRDDTGDGYRAPSGFPVKLLLKLEREVPRPVDVVRVLAKHGLSLSAAHARFQALAEGVTIGVELRSDEPAHVIADLNQLGVSASRVESSNEPTGERIAEIAP